MVSRGDDGYSDIPREQAPLPAGSLLPGGNGSCDESEYAQVRFAQQGASVVDDGSDDDGDQFEAADGYAHLKAKSDVLRIKMTEAQRQQLLLTHGAYSSTLESSSQATSDPLEPSSLPPQAASGPPMMRPRSKTTEDGYTRFQDQNNSCTTISSASQSQDSAVSKADGLPAVGRIRVASPTSARSIELLAVTRCRAATSTVMELHPYTQDVRVGDRPKLATPAASRGASDHGTSAGGRHREPAMQSPARASSHQGEEGNAAINPGYESDGSEDSVSVDEQTPSTRSWCSVQ